MKAPNITPGPWYHTGNYISTQPEGGIRVAWICGDGPQPQWQPNAKAIAATPQLCAALVELEQWCRAWSKDDGDLSKKAVRANFHKFAAQQAERARQALTAAGYTITP